MAKAKTPTDEKFENQDFDLFKALAAIDKKDYKYFDNLTDEQRKQFVPFLLLQYISSVKGNKDLQNYYLQSTNYHANKYMLDNMLTKKEFSHSKLQWLMLCAISPGIGSQFHPWIPHIKDRVSKLKDTVTVKEVKDFYKKIYPKTDDNVLSKVAEEFVNQHKKKYRIAKQFPNMKLEDIELLSQIISDSELDEYENERTF